MAGVHVGLGTLGPGYGEFHSHGGVIAVDATNGTTAVAVNANKNASGGVTGDAKVHAFETAWVIKGNGNKTRLKGNATFEAPFQWQSGTDTPVPGLISQTGADMFVETDCNPRPADTDCEAVSQCVVHGPGEGGTCEQYSDPGCNVVPDSCSGGDQPHLMLYSATCSSTWFDVVTGACRP
jgi:hypothetical protein